VNIQEMQKRLIALKNLSASGFLSKAKRIEMQELIKKLQEQEKLNKKYV
jgi:hypothetical protein